MAEMVECPGEAHEMDNTFNPSTQGPYGNGYHFCDVCDGEGEITEEEYQLWLEEQLILKLQKSKENCGLP